MAEVYEKSIEFSGESGLLGLTLALSGGAKTSTTSAPATPALSACFHCGEPCSGAAFNRGEKNFCCQGCLAVHDLLTEAGLTQFYQLERHPGTRVQRTDPAGRWKYLDEPAVREKLLDFSDGKACRVTFKVPAIHCVACVWLLENLFRLHAGVGRSTVNFLRREAAITFDPVKITLGQLAALLASVGYEPSLTLGELERPPVNGAWKRRWLQIGVAGFAFGNIMLFSIPAYLGLDSFSQPVFRALFGYLSLALALPVLVYSAADYWKSAFVSLRQRALTLEVPIALGLAALYLQSALEIGSGRGEGYLDSLAGLVFFLLCGRAFQQKAFDRITFDRDYKCFFPLSVLRKTADGENTVALSELAVGDRLLLRHGELIPADSRLLQGDGLVDYSFVTGESEPVRKAEGDYLYAGGKQAGGAIEVEIVKPVSQSYLVSLWSHEAFAKNRDDRLNTLTNRYSRRFTKLVIAIAIGAAFFWAFSGDLSRGLKAFTSVLIVACPCALALAAPFALGTAQRLLARLNIFLRNGLVVERIAEVDTVVFDKTGTLTKGGDLTVRYKPAGRPLGIQELEAVRALALQSTHPHSMRICSALAPGGQTVPVEGFAEVPGCGIQGTAGAFRIQLGSLGWLRRSGVSCADHGIEAGGGSWLAIDGEFRGVFVFCSHTRPRTAEMLRELAPRCRLALLSGDNERDRDSFRQLFGAEARLSFNQTPLDKLGFINGLQDSHRTVMMVGDGLNDAGALKQSDVGVAVVERIGVFSPASDVIMEGARVSDLAKLLGFARSSARIVRLSFGVSAIYNAVGISIAAAGILSPVICAVLMPLSSISVVLFACAAVNLSARRLRFVQGDGDAHAIGAERQPVFLPLNPQLPAS